MSPEAPDFRGPLVFGMLGLLLPILSFEFTVCDLWRGPICPEPLLPVSAGSPYRDG